MSETEALQRLAERLPGVLFEFRCSLGRPPALVYASPRLEPLTELDPQALAEDARPLLERVHPEDRATLLASAQHCGEGQQRLRLRLRTAIGAERWIELQATQSREPDGATLWHGYVCDVTEHERQRQRLELAGSAFESSHDGIMITDADNRIVDVNPAFERITGYPREDVLGRNPRLLSAGAQPPAFYRALWRTLLREGSWRGELMNRRKDGSVYAELLSISVLRDPQGRVRNYVAVFSDISREKAHERRLARLAHHDALTGVPNRRLLDDRLEQAMAQARRHGRCLAVCYLDLDGFKPVNDRHGHATGDRLLIELTRRLRARLRETDTLLRIGGDEFVLLLGGFGEPSEIAPVMERMLGAVSRPFRLRGCTVRVGASIGVALYPQDGNTAETLIQRADSAMYAVKQNGRGHWQRWQPHSPAVTQN